MREVIVVIGAGSIGQAIARRVSAGKQVEERRPGDHPQPTSCSSSPCSSPT